MYIVHMYIYIYIYICIYTWDIIIDDPFKHDILDMDINGNCVVHLLFLTLFFDDETARHRKKEQIYYACEYIIVNINMYQIQ